MTTRDEYNNAEWDKFVAGTAGVAPPVPLKCSGIDCTGNITARSPDIVIIRDDGLPQKKVECDTCSFGANGKGWQIANYS